VSVKCNAAGAQLALIITKCSKVGVVNFPEILVKPWKL